MKFTEDHYKCISANRELRIMIAEVSNRLLEEYLKTCPKVYTYWKSPGNPTEVEWNAWESLGDTHQAYLFDVMAVDE